MKRKFRLWHVVSGNNKILFSGRLKDCDNFWYPRWCYERRYDLRIVWCGEYLD